MLETLAQAILVEDWATVLAMSEVASISRSGEHICVSLHHMGNSSLTKEEVADLCLLDKFVAVVRSISISPYHDINLYAIISIEIHGVDINMYFN